MNLLRNQSPLSLSQVIVDRQSLDAIDTVVHLGAGRCRELDEYLAAKPQRIVLVEADPELADALRARTAHLPQVQVNDVAVAERSGPSTFYRYNLPDVNSLHPATSLLELFPGLKLLDRMQLESVTPALLIKELNLNVQKENLLIIDIPGEELPVLRTLEEVQQLNLFGQIRLHCSRQPLYKNSEPAARVLRWLREKGFDLVEEAESKDPDFPCWIVRRNTLQLRNTELQQRIKELSKTNDEHSKRITVQMQTIEQLAAEHDKYAKLTTDCQRLAEELATTKDEQAKLIMEQKQTIDQVTAERDEYAKSVAELQNAVEMLTSERDEQEHRQRLMDEELMKAESQIELISDILIREKTF